MTCGTHRIQNPCSEIFIDKYDELAKICLREEFMIGEKKWYRIAATDEVYFWASVSFAKDTEYRLTPLEDSCMYLDLVEPVYLMAILKWQ